MKYKTCKFASFPFFFYDFHFSVRQASHGQSFFLLLLSHLHRPAGRTISISLDTVDRVSSQSLQQTSPHNSTIKPPHSAAKMKSTFHSAILALALSVSAAPVEKYSSANKGVHSSTHSLVPRGGPSGDKWYDESYGPPVFFGDEPSTSKSPAGYQDGDDEESSSSSTHSEPSKPSGQESDVASSSGIPLFGGNKPSTSSSRASSAPSTHTSSTHTSSMHTFSTHTKATASSTHKSSKTQTSTPIHKSSSRKSKSDSHHTNSHKSNSHKSKSHKSITTTNHDDDDDDDQTLAPARHVTPNFKSYIAKAGTLMFGMQNPVCSAVTLIFARGTTEKGNMGTCVGPDLAAELRKKIPSLSVQGVDYPANSKGNTRYGASGGPYMAMLAREARKQCPDTKIVLAGYSQGARVIYGALEKTDRPFDGEDVAAVVAFGDPLNGREKAYKGVDRDDVLQVCGDSDDRCQRGEVDHWVHGGHVSYGKSAEDVAEWIRKKVE